MQSNAVFRNRKTVEVFFVRFKSADEQGRDNSFSPKLTQAADDERPKVFIPVTEIEKEQLIEKYRQKLNFAKTKDLDTRYDMIYAEKLEQYWRFAKCEVGDDADDTHVEDTESEEGADE